MYHLTSRLKNIFKPTPSQKATDYWINFVKALVDEKQVETQERRRSFWGRYYSKGHIKHILSRGYWTKNQ